MMLDHTMPKIKGRQFCQRLWSTKGLKARSAAPGGRPPWNQLTDHTNGVNIVLYTVGTASTVPRGGAVRIIIRNTAGIPIYEQIKEQIKEAILNDELREGEALPSIRQLARDLKISVITTTRAYSDLEKDGYVANVQGKGCFVAPKNNELFREQILRRIEENLTAAIDAASSAGMPKDEIMKMLDLLIEEHNHEYSRRNH